jgi:PAS domain S-box-containing protein
MKKSTGASKIDELEEVRSRVVNATLIVSTVAGIPTLGASIYRAIIMDIPFFIYAHVFVYLFVLAITLFRKRINYSFRAFTVINLLFCLAVIDFLKTGFLSEGYLWLTSAIIITALLYDLRKSIIMLVASLILIGVIFLLFKMNVIVFNIDYNSFARMPVTMMIRVFNIILLGLIISLSIRHIHRKMNESIIELRKQKESLEDTAAELEMEIEIRKASELQVANSEKNFRNIFEKSSDPILIVGNNSKILDFNLAFQKISGQTENEIFNMQYEELLPVSEREKFNTYYQNPELMPMRFDIQYNSISHGTRYYDISPSIITYDDNLAFLLIIHDLSEKMNIEKRNYLTAIEAEEKERSRFSKELHDGLGPLLSTLKIYLEIFFTNPNDSEIRERIESTLTESIKSVKEISNNISPYILENMGLIKAVSSFIEKIRFGKKLEIDFQTNLSFRIEPEIEISVYRFITELLNNTIKHAQASTIQIEINENQSKLEIRYTDNGIGFSIDEVSQHSKGIGLYNLRSRIEKLGGKIEMISSPGSGFSMLASLRIEQKQE